MSVCLSVFAAVLFAIEFYSLVIKKGGFFLCFWIWLFFTFDRIAGFDLTQPFFLIYDSMHLTIALGKAI